MQASTHKIGCGPDHVAAPSLEKEEKSCACSYRRQNNITEHKNVAEEYQRKKRVLLNRVVLQFAFSATTATAVLEIS